MAAPGSKDEGARFLDGDPLVLAKLQRAIRVAFAGHRRLRPADLEDVEQETMAALLIAVREGRFRGESSLASFGRRIAHFKCIDRGRARGRRPPASADAEELKEIQDPRDSVQEVAERQRLLAALQAELSPECADLLRRVAVGDDYGEIAETLQIKEGTLRVRISRCRQAALEIRERLLSKQGATGP